MSDPVVPESVVAVARRAVAIAMRERREALPHAYADIIAQMNQRGMMMSGRTVVLVRELVAGEYQLRAALAWQAWLRALSTQQAVVTTDLRDFLLAEIERALEAESQDLPERMAEVQRVTGNVGGANPEQFLLTSRAKALEKVASEIDYTILEATSKHAKGANSATFNFYGQVGAVLTGPGATATVTISAEQRQTIAGALTAVQEVVGRAPELDPEQRSQVVELVTEAKAEVQKEKPNGFKLRGVLSGVGTAVQTLGSAREAYNVLKGAAALIGVHLP